jgi:hypothetical protein
MERGFVRFLNLWKVGRGLVVDLSEFGKKTEKHKSVCPGLGKSEADIGYVEIRNGTTDRRVFLGAMQAGRLKTAACLWNGTESGRVFA